MISFIEWRERVNNVNEIKNDPKWREAFLRSRIENAPSNEISKPVNIDMIKKIIYCDYDTDTWSWSGFGVFELVDNRYIVFDGEQHSLTEDEDDIGHILVSSTWNDLIKFGLTDREKGRLKKAGINLDPLL